MSDLGTRSAGRPGWDKELTDIADYVCDADIDSEPAFEAAHHCLMDALAAAFRALDDPACTKLLGPVVPGATLNGGARVPGTSYELEPVMAAFNIGAMIRWTAVDDTRQAADRGHPSDNLGGILAAADYLSRQHRAAGRDPLTMHVVLTGVIKAHEIQGCLALGNSYRRVGLDHVLLVRVASSAVLTRMLGGDRETVLNALSQAWIDGGPLCAYRYAPNAGSRKRWAAGDAASRAVQLALISMTGETGCPTVLSAKEWGYYDALFGGIPFRRQRPYGSYVMESSLSGRSILAECHAQTALEAGMALHETARERIDDIDSMPVRRQAFVDSVSPKLSAGQWQALDPLYADRDQLLATPVDDFMALLVA